jgi:hypothetical protein
MAIRFAVQASSREECLLGLDQLCAALGVVPAMKPTLLSDNRWMARAVTPTPPADDDTDRLAADYGRSQQ